jgi:hypothetical protein
MAYSSINTVLVIDKSKSRGKIAVQFKLGEVDAIAMG